MIDVDKIASEIESCVIIPSETDFLREHAKRAKCGLIEIGSQYGRSSVILGAVAKEKEIPMVCVDMWEDDKIYEQFIDNLSGVDLLDTVKFARLLSEEAFPYFKENSIDKYDFIFIDGSHKTEDVRFDYENWSSILKRPATVVFHDIENRNVRIVFEEAIKDNDYAENKNIGAVYLV